MTSSVLPLNKMTTFEDLPAPIMVKIMNLLPDTDVDNAAEACSKIDILMGDQIERFFDPREDVSVRRCVGRQNKYLWIHEKKDKEPYLLYVAAVTYFNLEQRIAINDYNLLAESFQNLGVLVVEWLYLEMLGSVGAWFTFPKLIGLHLGGPVFKKPLITDYSKNEVLKNLTGFIAILGRVWLPSLTHFGMNIIFEESRGNCLLDSLLTFLSRHEKSLERLDIAMARTPYQDHQDGFNDWLSVPNWEERLGKLNLNLKTFGIYFYPYYESENFLQLIDHVTSTQTSLKSHMMLYPRFQTFYTDILDNNFRTLKHVGLSIWIFYTLDAKVFEQCSVLKTLHLHARPKKLTAFETENYGGEPASSELVNIECLPKSLASIEIVNFFIETKDCAKFTTEFPKLECLSLFGIGEKEELGFTMELVSAFIHRGGIGLEIYRGFNQKFKLESQGSDDGARVFMNLYCLTAKTNSSLSLNQSWDKSENFFGEPNLTASLVTGKSKFRPHPFDEGESKLKVYVGQKEW